MGDDGDNVLIGRGGADRLDGGDGIDTASYSASSEAVTVALNGQVDAEGYATGHAGGDAAGDRLKNIENLIGTDFVDTLTGDGNDNRIDGGKGGDAIDGDGYTTGHSGGDAAGDRLKNITDIEGSEFADTFTGSNLNNNFDGGGGSDTLDGGGGADTASYKRSSEGVVISLANTADDQGYSTGHSGGDAAGDRLKNIENLIGTDFVDTLTGDAGGNILEGGAAADVLDGGDGSDTASYASSNEGVSVSIFTGTGRDGHAEGDSLSNIENLIGSEFNDYLSGDSGDNHFQGLGGNDWFYGGVGADSFDGGAGNDGVNYYESNEAVYVLLHLAPDDEGYYSTHSGGDAAGDRLKNIENITGSNYDDTIAGNAENNTFWGNDGDDVLYGLSGNDWLYGESGGDTLDGGNGYDGVSYYTSDEGVVVSLNNPTDDQGFITGHSGGDAAGDKLKNIEYISGSEFDDHLVGNDNANRLYGNAGIDEMYSLGGNDWLYGREGGDTIDGGDGNDGASYYDSSEGVLVSLRALDNLITTDSDGYLIGHLNGDAVGDRLKNIEKLWGSDHQDDLYGDDNENTLCGDDGGDTLDGGGGDDVLYGGDGDDIIIGGSGEDVLIGEDGRNLLTGGSDNDIFVLTHIASSLDRATVITDFDAGRNLTQGDLINVSPYIHALWVDQSRHVDTGASTTNNAAALDTVLYTNAAMTNVLAILEDYTGSMDYVFADTSLTVTMV